MRRYFVHESECCLPLLVPGRGQLLAMPQHFPLACTAVPDHATLFCRQSGSLLSETKVAPWWMHVMPTLVHHFGIDVTGFAIKGSPSSYTATTIYQIEWMDAIAPALEAYWLGGGWQVEPFAVTRIRPARVLGQAAAGAQPGRLETPDGFYYVSPGDYIVCELDGQHPRVVPRELMRYEFARLIRPADRPQTVVDLTHPIEPEVTMVFNHLAPC